MLGKPSTSYVPPTADVLKIRDRIRDWIFAEIRDRMHSIVEDEENSQRWIDTSHD